VKTGKEDRYVSDRVEQCVELMLAMSPEELDDLLECVQMMRRFADIAALNKLEQS
jgi:hypothetical protein